MNKKLNIAIIFGGRSGEHEVSLVSATSVIENLDRKKYNIIPIGITKTGEWLAGKNVLNKFKIGLKNKKEIHKATQEIIKKMSILILLEKCVFRFVKKGFLNFFRDCKKTARCIIFSLPSTSLRQ